MARVGGPGAETVHSSLRPITTRASWNVHTLTKITLTNPHSRSSDPGSLERECG